MKGLPFPYPTITNLCPFTQPSMHNSIFISDLITFCRIKLRRSEKSYNDYNQCSKVINNVAVKKPSSALHLTMIKDVK